MRDKLIRDIEVILKGRKVSGYFYKRILVTDLEDPILSGLYVEKIPTGSRIWKLLFPIYHGEEYFHLSFSSVLAHFDSNHQGVENKSLLEKIVIDYLVENKCQKIGDFLNHIQNLDISGNLKIRCKIMSQIYDGLEDVDGLYQNVIRASDSCRFEWWNDLVKLSRLALVSPDLAKQELLNRQRKWKEKFKILV